MRSVLMAAIPSNVIIDPGVCRDRAPLINLTKQSTGISGRRRRFQLPEPLEETLPLQARQAIDPEHAVELIDLVLDDRGLEVVRLLLVGRSVEVAVAEPDARGPGDPLADARHADTALLM